MNYFFDTEFYERGPDYPIELISLGIVAEDGREFYAENADVKLSELSPWLQDNVVPFLERTKMASVTEMHSSHGVYEGVILPHRQIGQEVMKFLGGDLEPRFWGYFMAYDWVVFCQLFGGMMQMPSSLPMYCNELMQLARQLTIPKRSFPPHKGSKHNALEDARWHKEVFDYLVETHLKIAKKISDR